MEASLGDRMKRYEQQFGGNSALMPLIPAICRLDGRCFHNFTRGLDRPFDGRLISLMDTVTTWLVAESGAVAGYVQSDEISLVWTQKSYRSEMFFGGRIAKIQSVLAAMCSVRFNRLLPQYLPSSQASQEPVFDCRVWSVPNNTEAVNYLIWRQQDAMRNSISGAAQSMFSHKQLHGKTCKQMQEMMFQDHGVNWSTKYSGREKNGLFVLSRQIIRPYTAKEIEKLPEQHEAKSNPNLTVKRREYIQCSPCLTQLDADERERFIFEVEAAKTDIGRQ